MSTKFIGFCLCALGATFGSAIFACDRNSNNDRGVNTARRDEPANPPADPMRDPVTDTVAADHPGNTQAPMPGDSARVQGTVAPSEHADNSARNAQDRKGNTLTPLDQGNSEGDRRITQEIRKAVVADGELSMDGKNVKIITNGGRVTLRGPVKSEGERFSIESKAKSAPGVKAIDNQLEVEKH